MMTHVKDIVKKMCVIGEAAVGKTSLIRRFVVDKFDDRYIATIGSKTSAKSIHIPKGNLTIYLKLQIWDIISISVSDSKNILSISSTSFLPKRKLNPNRLF